MIKSHQHFTIGSKLILERAVLIPPFTVTAKMPDEACFLFTRKGQARVISQGTQLNMKESDGIVAKCGTHLNKWLKTTPDSEPCEAIAVHFNAEIIQKAFDGKVPDFIRQESSDRRVCVQRVQIDAMLENYVESLLFYFNNPSLVNDELLYLKVKELILMLGKTDNADLLINIFHGIFDPEVFSFKEIIHNNLYENLSLEDWANLTNLSVSTFKRKFADAFGDTPARYVRNKKLEKAADLLSHSSKRVSDIAYECGFEDVAYFSKSFSNKFQQTPSDFRNRPVRS